MNFSGYVRKDGLVGTRNHVGVIASASCTNDLTNWIATRVEGCVPYGQITACGDGEPDETILYRTLINIGKNPNLAAVLVVGPDCECNDVEKIAQGISETGKPVDVIKLHYEGGVTNTIEKGVHLARMMASDVNNIKAEQVNVSALRLGVTCGGSTPISGIVTNAAMGSALDLLVGYGGSGGFGETPEVIGVEHVLAERSATHEVGQRLIERVERCEKRYLDAGMEMMGSNPNPQNIADGLSSVEEKGLGGIAKGGTSPLMQVCDYGEIPSGKGMFFIDTPGNDLVCLTALVAAGCQVITYSTESACPYGVPFVPVIKTTANLSHFEKYHELLDFYVDSDSALKDIKSVGKPLFEMILKVASGQKTKSETLRYYGVNRVWSINPTT